MSYEFYLFCHLGAVLTLFLTTGALLFIPTSTSKKQKMGFMSLHGLSILVIFITGFGLMAKLHILHFPSWIIAKLIIWTVLGVVLPIFIAKKRYPKLLFTITWALGIIAVYLVVHQLSFFDSV